MAVSATGPVARIYTNTNSTYIRLKNLPSSATPKSGYFRLQLSHANYNALYSLVLAAAMNGHNLRIRTTANITSTSYGVVSYMVVDF